MLKKPTPLWRKAHFEVKTYKARHVQKPLGSWDVQKVHVVAARSTCRSQNVQNTTCSRHFWMLKRRLCGRRKGFFTLPKWRFCSISKKKMAGVGHVKRICKDGFCVAGAIQETFSSEMLGGQAADFLGKVAFWSIRSSGLLRWFCDVLRDRCSTSYDLASLFRGRRSTLDRWSGNIAKKHIGRRPPALHSTFHFWRKSRRIASFLTLSSSKIEEVSQNCFVFDVVQFKNWGSLAELLPFWSCQLEKLRKPRRLASFSSLQIAR